MFQIFYIAATPDDGIFDVERPINKINFYWVLGLSTNI